MHYERELNGIPLFTRLLELSSSPPDLDLPRFPRQMQTQGSLTWLRIQYSTLIIQGKWWPEKEWRERLSNISHRKILYKGVYVS